MNRGSQNRRWDIRSNPSTLAFAGSRNKGMTDEKVPMINRQKSEIQNSSMTKKEIVALLLEHHLKGNVEGGERLSEEGPRNGFIDESGSNDYNGDNYEKIEAEDNIWTIVARKVDKTVAETLTPKSLEHQATLEIKNITDEKDKNKKNYVDGPDVPPWLMTEVIKGMIQDHIYGKDSNLVNILHSVDSIAEEIKAYKATGGITRGEKNFDRVDGRAHGDHSLGAILKQDAWDSGFSEQESLHVGINKDDDEHLEIDEHKSELNGLNSCLQDKSEDIRRGSSSYVNYYGNSAKDLGGVQKKHVTETLKDEDVRDEYDSGFSDPGSQDGCTNQDICRENERGEDSEIQDEDRSVHSNTDRNSIRDEEAEVNPTPMMPERSNKKRRDLKTRVKARYSRVPKIPDLSYFIIVLFLFVGPVMCVLGNMEVVWCKEGDNATLNFPIENHDPGAEQVISVRFKPKRLPFCHVYYRDYHQSGGELVHDGFKDDGQPERFIVSNNNQGIKISITAAQIKDEDIFVFRQIGFYANGSTSYISKEIFLKVLPRAQCYLLDHNNTCIVVHCRRTRPGVALFCFQGATTYRPDSIYGNADNAEFWMENNGEKIVCCTEARYGRASISAKPEKCRDFSWPQTPPMIMPVKEVGNDKNTSMFTSSSIPQHSDNPPFELGETTYPPTSSSGSLLSSSFDTRFMIGILVVKFLLRWCCKKMIDCKFHTNCKKYMMYD